METMENALTTIAAYAARALPAERGMEPVAIIVPAEVLRQSGLPVVPRSFSRIVAITVGRKKRRILLTRAVSGEVMAAKLIAQAAWAGSGTSAKKAASSRANATHPRPNRRVQ